MPATRVIAKPPLRTLHVRVNACRNCDLWSRATQGVAGEGPPRATMALVGEQPGNEEDLQGRPFVGPAGGLLRRALADAGVPANAVYLTNAVKHFKWIAKGKRRLHDKPSERQVRACMPWLRLELEEVEPDLVVALGATAAQALLGPSVRVLRQQGEVLHSDAGDDVFVTVHPSSVLRSRHDAERRRAYHAFVEDLRAAAAVAVERRREHDST